MANVSGASLAPIYNRLNAAPSYHPLEADTFADWSLEAGDIVTVTRDGKSYESPVHSSTVTWKKGQQVKVSSGGNEERDSVSKMSQRKFNRGSSGLRATEERYRQIETSYNGMRSGLILASSSAALYVNNKYTQMQSGLFLTESSAHLYTNNRYTQMQSGLKLTESSAHLYTNNKYTQMQSGLSLSSSSAALYVNNKYTQMKSGLVLSESSARLYVDSKYTQMQAGLSLTESSAMLYAKSRTTRAYILTRINADGEGEALIDADKIKLRGDVTLDGVMYVGSGSNIMFSGNILAQLNGGAGGGVSANTLVVNPNGCLTFGGTNPLIQIYGSDMATAIKSASVSNNTLTLTRFNGTSVNFSKATWQTGEWSSSGAFTARAKQQNGSTETEVSTITRHLTTGERTWDGNVCTVPIRAWYGNTPPTYEDCNYNVTVDASDIRTAGKNDVTLNNASWQYDGDNVDTNRRNSNTVTVSTNGRPTQLSKSATIYLDTSASWSGNSKSIYVRKDGSSGEHIAIGSVDASARYNAGYNAGFDAVTGNDITLQGDGTSPKSSKPSIAATWSETSSGKKKVTAYIWAKHSNGSWYKLRSFSFIEP